MSDAPYRGPYPGGQRRRSGMQAVLFALPLTIVPLALYNIIGLTSSAIDWTSPVMGIPMPSGGRIELGLGDITVVVGLLALFFEVLKATATGEGSIIDHMLSTMIFAIALVELLLVPYAASAAFFVLVLICFFDVIAGFSVTIRAARRDVGFTPAG